MNDGFATAAWWIAAIVAALMFLLVIQILVLRGILARRRNRAEQFRAVWEPLLAECVIETPVGLQPLERNQIMDFLLIWNHMQESLSAEAKTRLNEVARSLGVDDAASAMVLHGGLSDRLVGLTALGHMKDRRLWGRMTELLMGDDAVVSLCAARALVRIDPEDAAQIVIDQIANRPDWPTATVAGILREAGPHAISTPLAEAVGQTEDGATPRLIRLLELAHSEVAAPVVHAVITRTDSTEVLTACLRIANDPALLDRIRDLSADSRWPVRVLAIQALGRIGTHEDEERLVRALGDSQWWVRYRAAQALAALPLMGMQHLHHLSETVEDRFGRDILRQVIAEEELAC